MEDGSLIFYIPHICTDDESVIFLNYCLRSIKMFYPTSQIIVCESPSTYKSEIKIVECDNYLHIANPIPNSMTLGCIQHYLENYRGSGKKIITLHDSMILKSRFNQERLNQKFGFVWYFNNNERTNICQQSAEDKPEFLSYFQSLSSQNRDFAGCFGLCIFGDYEQVEALWNQLSYDDKLKDKKINVYFLMNQERLIGICSFYLKLVHDVSTCSLCNSIFDCPTVFKKWFNNHSLEQIQNINYKESCIKLSKARPCKLKN